ncbi:MAG: ketopantoate reductase family protein [Anaerolineae bacterium]|nr:ketopantoate reductase family protein [Anaerolineae bacterium]
MRILFYGAGVLGSLYASRLHAAGHDVTLLARGQRLADLQEHGVVLENARTGVRTTAQVPLIDTLQPDDVYDLVVVIMRKNQVADILPALAANKSPTILFLGNNVTGPEAYIKAVGRGRVLQGFALAGGERKNHVVRYATGSDEGPRLILGELDGTASPRVQQIAAAFFHGGIDTEISPNIDAWLKTHWALVGPLAGAIYASRGDVHRLARTRDARILIVRAIREGLRVVRALDYPVQPPGMRLIEFVPETVLIVFLARMLDTERAELALASHALAARDEMAALTDEFRALKHQSGVWTPYLDRLTLYIDPEMPALPQAARAIPVSWQGTLAMLAGLLVVYNVVGNVLSFLLGRASREKE